MLENWSSRDVQRDPEGFLRTQQQERERQQAEAKKNAEAADPERFKRSFVAKGGDPRAAEAQWRRTRSEHAAQSASAKSEAARREMHRTRMRAV
jgi:hypothetical protein